MKKIIILTSKGGEGLISGSKAIADGLKNRYGPDVDVSIVDFFDKFGSVGQPLTHFYNLLLRKSLWFNACYVKAVHFLRFDKWRFFYRNIRPKFKAFLEEESPDAIVVTSKYIVSFLSDYKEKETLKPITFVGNIDPGTCSLPLWFGKNISKHLIPTPECLLAYQKSGYASDQAVQTKLAVREQFKNVSKLSKKSLREKYSLPISDFIVVFTGSREGLEEFYPLIKQVLKRTLVHCLVICGSHEALKLKLMDLSQQRLTIIGWTDHIHEILRASDVAVAKPGKQTMIETIATLIPMISLCYPLVMDQELGNLEFMRNRNILIEGRSRQEIIYSIQKISQNSKLYLDHVNRLKQVLSDIDSEHVAKTIWQEIA